MTVPHPGSSSSRGLGGSGEQAEQFEDLLARLPYDQREVIVLHLHHGTRFSEIAEAQHVSINTVQSRYRYGMDKLRSMLNGEVKE